MVDFFLKFLHWYKSYIVVCFQNLSSYNFFFNFWLIISIALTYEQTVTQLPTFLIAKVLFVTKCISCRFTTNITSSKIWLLYYTLVFFILFRALNFLNDLINIATSFFRLAFAQNYISLPRSFSLSNFPHHFFCLFLINRIQLGFVF